MNKRFKKKFKKEFQTYRIPSIEIDRFNIQTLKAIYVKLVRDYVGFFVSLQKLYGQSKQRKRIDETVGKIRKTVTFLRYVLNAGTITKEDAEILTNDIEEINKDKDYFLEQAQDVRSLRERVSKVSETTGISPEDLNITKGIVEKGAKQARERVGARKPSVFRGAMPETRKTIKGLAGGVATAALGPFTPLASMAYGTAKDVLGLGQRAGRFATEKVREGRQQRLEKQLRPFAYGAPPKELEQISTERGRGLSLGGIRGVSPLRGQSVRGVSTRRSREESVSSLMYFFDKKAHKAKWTRTVLKWIKESAKTKKGGIFGGLLSGIKNLLPAIAAVGLALGKAGLAGAVAAFTAVELYRLTKLTGEYFDVLKNVKDFRKKQVEVLARQEQKVAGRAIFAETPEERQAAKKGRDVFQQARQEILEKEAKSWKPQNLIKQWKTGAVGVKTGVSGLFEAGVTKLGLRPRTDFAPSGVLPSMEAPREASQSTESVKIQKESLSVLKNVEEAIKKDREVPAIRQPGLGDMYDSGTPLLNEAASGGLTIED